MGDGCGPPEGRGVNRAKGTVVWQCNIVCPLATVEPELAAAAVRRISLIQRGRVKFHVNLFKGRNSYYYYYYYQPYKTAF